MAPRKSPPAKTQPTPTRVTRSAARKQQVQSATAPSTPPAATDPSTTTDDDSGSSTPSSTSPKTGTKTNTKSTKSTKAKSTPAKPAPKTKAKATPTPKLKPATKSKAKKTPSPSKGKKKQNDDPAYVDDDASDEDAAPSPTAKAVAGTKRKAVSFDNRVYRDSQQMTDSEDEDVDDAQAQLLRELEENSDQSAKTDSPSSPKRQRTQSPKSGASPRAESITSQENGGAAGADPITAARDLFEIVERHPKTLDLDQISALFLVLQEDIFGFCHEFFSFDLSPAQEEAWPLHALIRKYYNLFKMTQYIADGSGCGWRNLFTKKEHRPHLVHGLLGEYFLQHIFKHTAFGFGESKLQKLRDLDAEYLRYDAFVRNKKKADYIREEWGGEYPPIDSDDDSFDDEFPSEPSYAEDVDREIRKFCKNVLELLHPLLPPEVFDPLRSGSKLSVPDSITADLMRNEIYFDLLDLIKKAVALHHCIRISGQTGLVVRIAPHVQRNTVFTADDANRNICVNATELNNSPRRPTDKDAKLKVKMTCFGRVEAVAPQGLDLEELEKEWRDRLTPVSLPTTPSSEDESAAEDAEGRFFPQQPYNMHDLGAQAPAALNPPDIPDLGWTSAILENNKATQLSKRFDRDTQRNLSPGARPFQGPYVTLYPRVAPSNLYCEWAWCPHSDCDLPNCSGQGGFNSDQTLAEAVEEARRERPVASRLEDAWYHCTHPTWMEKLFFAGFIAVPVASGIWQYYGSPSLVDSLSSVKGSAVNALVSGISVGSAGSAYISQMMASTAAPLATSGTGVNATQSTSSSETVPTICTTAATTTTVTQMNTTPLLDSVLESSVLESAAPTPMDVDDLSSTPEPSSSTTMASSTPTGVDTEITFEEDASPNPPAESTPTPEATSSASFWDEEAFSRVMLADLAARGIKVIIPEATPEATSSASVWDEEAFSRTMLSSVLAAGYKVIIPGATPSASSKPVKRSKIL